ncbi:MAG: hypothetical protein Q4G11_04450 [Gallicola sp.]|nr:hypothetical protein [Gallicola sp.]
MNSNMALSWLPYAAFGLLALFILGILFLNKQNKKEGPYVHFSEVKDATDIIPVRDKKEYFFFPMHKSGLADSASLLQSYLLKWITDGVIKKEEGKYLLEGSPVFQSNQERNWFVILNKFPGGVLAMEPDFRKEEEKSIRENIQGLRSTSIDYLLKNDYMKKNSSRIMNEEVEHYSYTEKGLEVQKELIRYRNYLSQKKTIEREEIPWLALFNLDYKDKEFSHAKIAKGDFEWAKRFSDFYKKVS